MDAPAEPLPGLTLPMLCFSKRALIEAPRRLADSEQRAEGNDGDDKDQRRFD